MPPKKVKKKQAGKGNKEAQAGAGRAKAPRRKRKTRSKRQQSGGFGLSTPLGSMGWGAEQEGGSWLGNILGGVASIPANMVIGATAGGVGALKGFGKPQRGGKSRVVEGADYLGIGAGPRRGQRGGSLLSGLSKAGKYARDHDVLSQSVGLFNPKVGKALDHVGLGQRGIVRPPISDNSWIGNERRLMF